MPTSSRSAGPSADPRPPDDEALRSRLTALCAEGREIWDRFAERQTGRPFHPFVAADYDRVCEALWPWRGRGYQFLEWGSATGVITVMADLLGYKAYGVELDASFLQTAQDLARRFDSGARFVTGSFLPTGYQWRPSDGDGRTGTVGSGPSGYLALGLPLDEIDIVFAYPWDGEQAMMRDLMRQYGRADALLILHTTDGLSAFRGDRQVPDGEWLPGARGPAYRPA